MLRSPASGDRSLSLLAPADCKVRETPTVAEKLRTRGKPAVKKAEQMPDPAMVDAGIQMAITHPFGLSQIVKIEGRDGPEWFDLWPDQRTVLDMALTERRLIILKARQLGITWTMMLLGLWDCISYPTGTTLVVSINDDEAKEALERAKILYDSTPAWFKLHFPVKVSNASTFSIAHIEGESRLQAISSSGNAGRGRTLRRIIADERARWENEAERMGSLTPAAADFGSIVEISTANGRNGFYGTYSQAVDASVPIDRGNGYRRFFINALSNPHRDLAWVHRERRSLEAMLPGLGAQEYPLTAAEAWRSTGNCAFNDAGLRDQEQYAVLPAKATVELREAPGNLIVADPKMRAPGSFVRTDPNLDGVWQVWEWPKAGRDYLISADVCGGVIGGDWSYASVFDRDSWDQVACLHTQMEPGEFAKELMLAGRLYASEVDGHKKPAMLVPEANNHGAAVVTLLWEARYPRVYRSEGFEFMGQRPTLRLGWLTTQKTRPVALQSLQEYVLHGLGAIRDEAAIGEMFRFIENDRGKWEADIGAHDDRVMAIAIGVGVLGKSRVSTSRVAQVGRRRRPTPYVPRVHAKAGY